MLCCALSAQDKTNQGTVSKKLNLKVYTGI